MPRDWGDGGENSSVRRVNSDAFSGVCFLVVRTLDSIQILVGVLVLAYLYKCYLLFFYVSTSEQTYTVKYNVVEVLFSYHTYLVTL